MNSVKKFTSWFWTTSAVVGAPVLIVLLAIGVQRSFFTLTCESAGIGCQYSLTKSDEMHSAIMEFVGQLLADNPNGDLVLEPRKKK
jgi:hypothetical protein